MRTAGPTGEYRDPTEPAAIGMTEATHGGSTGARPLMIGVPHGLYVHIPFCRERCAYCDFAIVAGGAGRAEEYADAVLGEMRTVLERHGPLAIDTVYFGGGTPSLVKPSFVSRIVLAARDLFETDETLHVSLEANPEDVTAERVAAWAEGGVRRITVGLQALTDEGLAGIGRPGEAEDGVRAIQTARRSGIRDLGADVIFGRPRQTAGDWQDELDRMSQLDVDHWSCYALETTSRTPLARAIERGRTPAPDPDLQATMYEMAVSSLSKSGYRRYEISNFASPGHESRHNLKYWQDASYVGLGQSAASYVGGARWTNARRYSEYVRRARAGVTADRLEPYDPARRAGEAIVFGLRLDEGVDLKCVAVRHGEHAVEAHRAALERGVDAGLATRHGPRICLTDRGRLLADELFIQMM